jgi:hypothetical protein
MDCTFQTKDGNIRVQTDAETDSEDRKLKRAAVDGSTNLSEQIYALQQSDPELWKKDLGTINAKLEADQLLPGYKIVSTRDENGVERGADGQPVMRTEAEIFKQGLAEKAAVSAKTAEYTSAFDKFHEGFEGNPLEIFMPAQLTKDSIGKALENPDLSSADREALENVNQDFYKMSGQADGNREAISREEIALWEQRQQTYLDNKLTSFVTGDPASRDPYLHAENGDISIFDWENRDQCAVDYKGNQYIYMMTTGVPARYNKRDRL